MKKKIPKLYLSKVFILFVFLMSYTFSINAQTELITASDGGFENATTTFAANGWTVVNDATNAYYVGTAAINGGSYGASPHWSMPGGSSPHGGMSSSSPHGDKSSEKKTEESFSLTN